MHLQINLKNLKINMLLINSYFSITKVLCKISTFKMSKARIFNENYYPFGVLNERSTNKLKLRVAAYSQVMHSDNYFYGY